jgi:PilZ domain-containing protein
MSAEITVLIADPTRITALRDEVRLPGRVLPFASSNLVVAFDSIRTHQPGLVAIDGQFAATLEGQALIDRIDELSIAGSQTQLVARVNAEWATVPLPSHPPAAGAAPMKIDVKAVGLNTRRTPRFHVIDPRQAVVENGKASLVDLSVLGAQVISTPVLRPNQTITIALPDHHETLRVAAQICWAFFEERPEDRPAPYYRAGMEFTEAGRQGLDDYCRRHCAEDPLPLHPH